MWHRPAVTTWFCTAATHRDETWNVFWEQRRNPIVIDVPPPVKMSSLPLPRFWSESGKQAGAASHALVACTADELVELESLVNGTFEYRVTRDRSLLDPLPVRLQIVEAHRAETPGLWERYELHRRSAAARLAKRTSVNEVIPRTADFAPLLNSRVCSSGNVARSHLLFHGSNKLSGLSIMRSGFTQELIGTNVPSSKSSPMFGPGIYLAENASKADEYAHDGPEINGIYAFVISRAVLGDMFIAQEPGDYSGKVLQDEFDSVLGDRVSAVGTYKEFVFFEEQAIYPEYIVLYKRLYSEKDVFQPDGREAASEAGGRPSEVSPGVGAPTIARGPVESLSVDSRRPSLLRGNARTRPSSGSRVRFGAVTVTPLE